MRRSVICGGQMVDGFVGEGQYFVVDGLGDRKPVKVFEDLGDVVS